MALKRPRVVRAALIAAGVYVAVAGVYIWLSDTLLFEQAGAVPSPIWRLSVLKGTLFVLVTGLALFLLVWRLSLRVERSAERAWQKASAAVVASEERYRALAESATDLIFIFDPELRLSYLNSAAAAELGAAAAALTGRSVGELLSVDQTGDPEAALRRVLQSGKSEVLEGQVRLARRTLWLSTSLVPLRDQATGDVTGVLGVSRDITAFKRHEAVREATFAISQAANSSARLHDLLPEIHRAVAGLLPAENFYIALYDEERGLLSFPYFVDEVDQPPPPQPLGQGLTEYVLRTGRSLLASPEVFERLAAAGEVELVGAPSVDWLGIPLKVRDRTIGVLVVQSYREGVRFGEADRELLEFVSSQVAMAIERTRAEEALRESEERFRVLVETTPVGVLIIVGDAIVYANPGAARITGYSRDEMVGASFVTGVHPEFRSLMTERAFARQEGRLAADEFEIKIVTKGGEERWIHGSSGLAMLSGGPALVTTFFDVTERRRAEQEREESRRMLRLVLDTIPVRVFWKDLESRYLGCNRLFAQDAGLHSWEEVVGKTDFEMTWREQAALYRADDAAVIASGEAKLNYEEPQTTPSGSKLVLRTSKVPLRGADGNIFGVLGTYEDITDRKRAEEALKESEERYRSLVELSPDAIAIHVDGQLVFVNEQGARLLGYSSPAEMVGRHVLEFVHPDYHAVVMERTRRALLERQAQPLMGEVLLRADGTPVEVEVANTPFTYHGAPAVQVVVRDVSERRKVEERLRQAQKMEAVGQLAGGLAHDFNNILQALLSTTQVLKARHQQDGELATGLSEIEAYVRRGAVLARQLLLFARREVTRLALADLNEVVGATASMLRRLMPENVTLEVALACGVLPVRVDRGQIEQVLVNLAVNAREAMLGGGQLRVRTGANAGWAWLEVADTGVGIPSDVRARIFEPFFTTKAAGEGSGLGLSVVQSIAQAHGGAVEVESEPGRGALFRVTFPLAEEQPAVTEAPGPEPGPLGPSGSGARVLLVEDEEGTREGIRDALELLGYEVTAVGSAEAALALAAQPAFDVLLSDFLLPGMHGGELAMRLKGRWPELKVVIMSGYTRDEAIHRGVGEGVVRFLQKPFDVHALASELASALAE